MTRSDDVVAVVDEHPGRWLMITLTVDRSMWTCPEAAYERVCDRVREVTRAVSLRGIHVAALELQGKTGAGWPHWHLIIWAPDDRPLEVIREKVLRAWMVRTECVDHETGEVMISREPIGVPSGQKVEEARQREGVARYAAKYIIKPWPAVPTWMGESTRQLRKMRLSSGVFEWLESAGRHKRHRAGRRVSKSRRRPARRLFDRMASSGLVQNVFRREGQRLVFVRRLAVPSTSEGSALLLEAGASPVRAGNWSAMRWTISDAGLRSLDRRREQLREVQLREYRGRRRELEVGWDLMQERREIEAAQDEE